MIHTELCNYGSTSGHGQNIGYKTVALDSNSATLSSKPLMGVNFQDSKCYKMARVHRPSFDQLTVQSQVLVHHLPSPTSHNDKVYDDDESRLSIVLGCAVECRTDSLGGRFASPQAKSCQPPKEPTGSTLEKYIPPQGYHFKLCVALDFSTVQKRSNTKCLINVLSLACLTTGTFARLSDSRTTRNNPNQTRLVLEIAHKIVTMPFRINGPPFVEASTSQTIQRTIQRLQDTGLSNWSTQVVKEVQCGSDGDSGRGDIK